MDFAAILDSSTDFRPLATDARTGESTDLHGYIHDQISLQAALRATTAMPFMTGEPIEIEGRRFIDAGVSESVPIRTAIAQNATHIVALRTRRSDERALSPTRLERLLLSRWFARHAPGALEPWLNREALRGEEEHLLASHPAVLEIRPPLGSGDIGRTERGESALRGAVTTGRKAARDILAACAAQSRVAN
jgi:predicted patatin/cPLA2 family phospholipase